MNYQSMTNKLHVTWKELRMTNLIGGSFNDCLR